jgi:Mlc titration factor MtfA (ptsG expression regulator)
MFDKLFRRKPETRDLRNRLRDLSRAMPLLATLDDDERDRLADLAADFLDRKTVEGAGGLQPDERMQALLALQAALPALHLGLDLYSGWHAVILYPDEFRVPYQHHDPDGVVHEGSRDLSGEAWYHGPVILAWSHVERDALTPEPDGNVVIHELAHKLDMLNGEVNGMPPLHRGMDTGEWTRAMSAAFHDIERHLDAGLEPPIDPYAAHSPGEFFAVVSELYFAWPELLAEAYPAVYRQLGLYYRQDLLAGPE